MSPRHVILEEFLKHINEDEDLFKETFKLFGRVDVQEIFHAAETKTLDQLNLQAEDFKKLSEFTSFYREFINRKCAEYNKLHPEKPINIYGVDLSKYN